MIGMMMLYLFVHKRAPRLGKGLRSAEVQRRVLHHLRNERE